MYLLNLSLICTVFNIGRVLEQNSMSCIITSFERCTKQGLYYLKTFKHVSSKIMGFKDFVVRPRESIKHHESHATKS